MLCHVQNNIESKIIQSNQSTLLKYENSGTILKLQLVPISQTAAQQDRCITEGMIRPVQTHRTQVGSTLSAHIDSVGLKVSSNFS